MSEPQTLRGTVTLIVGPMFSGKSTELLRLLRRTRAAKKTWLLVAPKRDKRYFGDGEVMSTHDLETSPAKKFDDLADIEQHEIDEVDTVAIDEGQFFPRISEYVGRWSSQGKDVIVSALNGTFERKPFAEISLLYPMADQISHKTAICVKCGKDAPFTKRLITDDSLFLVGGKDMYAAVCGNCFSS